MQKQRRKLLMMGLLAWPGGVAVQAQGQAHSQTQTQTQTQTLPPPGAEAATRVISLGGSVTEIVYALGAGDRLVACDISSVYPPAAQALPKVGYYRDVPVEGIASLRPDLVLASEQAGPPAALARLRELGITVVVVSDTPALAALRTRIGQIARALALPQTEPGSGGYGSGPGQALIARIDAALAALPALPPAPQWPTALSIMAHGSAILAAGSGTAAHAVMQLAGVRNVLAERSGYKPVSAEVAVALTPQLIISTELSVQAQGGRERLLALPMLAPLQAARAQRLVVMDDLMYLTFGLRLAQAVQTLRGQCDQVLDATPGTA